MPLTDSWGYALTLAASENLQGTKPRVDAGSALMRCAYGDLRVTRLGTW